ncbi:hypothetical protein, partial [Anabaena subtropica]|uniref:hypothetical protein n=1 Tax=Anabaena subtropica TaxID=425380 RepID=UPI001A7EF75A
RLLCFQSTGAQGGPPVLETLKPSSADGERTRGIKPRARYPALVHLSIGVHEWVFSHAFDRAQLVQGHHTNIARSIPTVTTHFSEYSV